MSLETDLLQQILGTQGEMQQTLGEHSAALNSLKEELLGNGQPGKVSQLEQDFRVLRSDLDRRSGKSRLLDRLVNVIIAVGTALATLFSTGHFPHAK